MLLGAKSAAAAAEIRSRSPLAKGAKADGGLGNGDNSGNNGNGIVNNNTIVVDKSELSKLHDSKFETAAQLSESHVDTSIKGLREEI